MSSYKSSSGTVIPDKNVADSRGSFRTASLRDAAEMTYS